jgi:Tfp pilus assembly protein PilZ
MFIETKQPPALEQLLHVEFSLPGTTRSIASQASVAWINTEQAPANRNLPPGVGLQFLSLELNDLLAICRYIRLRSDQP